MTQAFKTQAFLESLDFERPIAEQRFKKEFFKRAHNVFFNKVLVELDEQKRERRDRRERIWTEGKKQLGFEDAFNVGSFSFMDDKDTVKEGEKGFESIEFDASYADDVFEGEGEVAKRMPVVHEAGAEEGGVGGENVASLVAPATNPPSPPLPKRNLQVNTSIAATGPSLSPTTSPINLGHSKLPGLTSATLLRESLSRASTAHSNRQASNKSRASSKPSTSNPNPNPNPNPSPSSNSNSTPGSTPGRRRRAFNRMTFFECLLDTLPVPDPHAPRYGQLQSPIRVTRRAASTTAEAMGAAAGSTFSILSPVVAPNRASERVGTASPTNRQAQLLSRSTATANSAPLDEVPAGFAAFFGPSEGSGSRSALGLTLPVETVLPPEEEMMGASVDELEALEIENLGLTKWTIESVNRCLTGDKPRKPKVYR